VYVLRDKKVLTNPIENTDEQIINKISSADAPIKKSEGPIVIDNLDQSNVEKISTGIAAKDDDAQSSILAPENFQPTWCPSGLSRTLKRKLQCARYKKLKQEGLANTGKQIFNKMDPILPQSSEKELAACSKLAEPISQLAKSTSPASSQVGQADSKLAKPTFSVAASLATVQVGLANSKSAKPTLTIPVAADMPLVYSVLVFVPVGVEGPSRNQDGFAPQSAIFQKPADHVNHLKPLHVKGYINGKLVNNMLVDNRAMVNLMPYSLYKKLGGYDEELIKTKRVVKGVGGNSILAKGFALMKLTIGS